MLGGAASGRGRAAHAARRTRPAVRRRRAARVRRARRVHRAVDHLVASRRATRGSRPTGRSPTWRRSRPRSRSCAWRRGAGPRCCTASRWPASPCRAWALLTKVFPGALAAGRDLRAPARAVRLLERGRADGGARRPAAAVARPRGAPGTPAANALAWPGLGLLLVCLMLSYSRGALLARRRSARALARRSCRCGCGRRSLLLGALRGGRAGGRVGVRARTRSRPTQRRSPRARTPGTSSARCSSLMVVALLAAGLAVDVPRRASGRPPAQPRRLVGARAARRAGAGAGRGADRARLGAGRARRPDLQDLAPAHRPERRARRPTRPTG